MANSFLNYFFEDFDEQALSSGGNGSLRTFEGASRLIQVPSRLMASKANCLLKSADEA